MLKKKKSQSYPSIYVCKKYYKAQNPDFINVNCLNVQDRILIVDLKHE